MVEKTANVGIAGRALVYIGWLPMRVESRLPDTVRRNFGARIFWLAMISLIGAPGLAVVFFEDVLTAVTFVAGVIAITGFLGYCEMYRALRAINARIREVDDGEFDISFATSRIDEIGESYETLEETAASLGDTIREAEEARQEAEAARQEAEALNDDLQQRARSFSDVMEAAADGDLTQRMDADSQSEPMRRIATSFNGMIAELEEMVVDLQAFADRVASRSETATTGVEEVESASERVSSSVRDISATTDRQSEDLAQVSSEMNDLSATIEEVASSADQVADLTEQAAARGEQGSDAAGEVIAEMNEIKATTEQTVGEVEALDEEMAEIGEIVELITDIAEQTNTLALNASIEAARAGEAGEGFAVVAEEVKHLAEEATEATRRIEELITEIQASTNGTVTDMRAMRERVASGMETIEDGITALDDISDYIEDVNRSVQEISDATDDQAASTSDVVTMVENVAEDSQDVSAQAEQASAAAEKQTSSLGEVTETVQTLSESAVELRSRLTDFDTNQESARSERPPPGEADRPVTADGGSQL